MTPPTNPDPDPDAGKPGVTAAKHTRGPWRVGDAGATVFGPKRKDGKAPKLIATVTKHPIPSYEDCANARLIASAPELQARVAVLEGLLAFAVREIGTGGHSGNAINCWLQDARAALAQHPEQQEGGA